VKLKSVSEYPLDGFTEALVSVGLLALVGSASASENTMTADASMSSISPIENVFFRESILSPFSLLNSHPAEFYINLIRSYASNIPK
jgi:hypothetical protein